MTVERITSTAWAARMSASQTATGRVFRYDPVTDVITTLAGAEWPPGSRHYSTRWLYRLNNKLYILGGFDIPNGDRDRRHLGVYSRNQRLGAEGEPASTAGLHTGHCHRQRDLHGWRQPISREAFSRILQTPLSLIRWLIPSARLPTYRGLRGRRVGLTSAVRCM